MTDVCPPPYSNNDVDTIVVIVDVCVVSALDFRIVKLHMQMYKVTKMLFIYAINAKVTCFGNV